MTRIASIDSFSKEDFVELKSTLSLTAFFGSGISIWEPTNLPTGQAFTKAIFNALFLNEEGKLEDPLGSELEELFRKIPFETVMEKCPDPNTLTSLLKRIFNISTYNNIHKVIAQALIDKKVHSLVTTNYDCCLEQAFADELKLRTKTDTSLPTRVTREEEIASACENTQVYFKIHGTADDNDGETLVFLLRQESALPKWKRNLLRSLLKDRILLIVGYSGLDFEICPEIPLTQVKQILWNFRSEEDITPNARRIMDQVPGFILIGDMRLLLSKVFSPVETDFSIPSINVEQSLRDNFSETTRLLWRVRLLNSMSYGTSALQLCSNLMKNTSDDIIFRIGVLEEYARALHYRGAYKSAARAYERAVSIANQFQLPKSQVCGLLLDVSDNWRCYGNFFKAYRSLKAARVLALTADDSKTFLLARANLKELLLLRRRYQIAQFFRLRFLIDRIRKRAELLIRSAAEGLLLSGSWFDFQQLRLWAERFDLPSDMTKPQDFYEAPPPREGYTHLGFPVAQMMVFRDAVDTGQLPLKEETAAEALSKYRLAQRIGLHTEAWKLSFLLLKKFPGYRGKELIQGFLTNFKRCEYSPIMRVALLLIRP